VRSDCFTFFAGGAIFTVDLIFRERFVRNLPVNFDVVYGSGVFAGMSKLELKLRMGMEHLNTHP
jgi:hypothetical protein